MRRDPAQPALLSGSNAPVDRGDAVSIGSLAARWVSSR